MHARSLPASPNWYSSRCSDVSSGGLLGVGAKNVIHLIEVSSASCRVTGELAGHRDLVSGFSFCQHPEQSHICVSSSTDGNVYFWDSNNKTLIRRNAAHQNPISGLHWSPADKNLVVSGDEKGVVVCHWFHTGDTASFFPEPRTIFCLTCSPHSWKSVAVGYKDGMIAIIDVSKKGEVMQRLRGHDNEIHSLAWSPLIGEDALYTRAEDHQATNEGLKGEESGCYVASGSKDQTVRIWSTAKGKGVMTLKLPFLKRRGSAVDPGVKERIWLNVHWPKGRPTQLVSSCFSGELAMWDLTNTGKQKWSLFGSLSEGQNHSRIVFNMSSVQLQDGRELLISTSMDREIKCWDLNSLSCCWTLPTLGGHVYTLSFSPVGVGCLALGVGDNMIRVWNTLSGQNQYDIRSFWQSIKSKVTALAWHPKKEGSLAFGTDDGKVGIYDVFINKPPQISSSYHRKTVYTLTWGPPVPPLSFGAEGKQTYSLYSCAGEGVILQHDPGRLNEEASDINKLISDTNNIQHKLSPHTDLSWKPDGKVVAIGNEDGSIDVYQGPSLKLLCSIQQHHKIINTLRWQHDHGSAPELHCLLASGSSNAIVYVHDLRSVIESPPETPVLLTEPYRRLCGHTGKITSMAWSPHHSARLVTASYDSTAQVWDVLEEAAISNYRGHTGYLLCVDWSPVDPDVIWTGGKDFTVQEWKVSEQEFTKPPKGKKMVLLQDKKQRKKSKPASVSTESVELKINGESVTEGKKAIAEQGLSEEEEEVRSTNGVESPGLAFQMQKKSTPTAKSKDKPAPDLTKKKKPRSMLPLSTSMDHRPKEELLQDCVTLASVRHSAESPAGCVPGQGEYIHLGLFHDRKALHCMFEAEEESHLEAGHYDSVVYLRLWSGDLQGALQLATERGELNDHLLSIAPMAGFQVWSRTVEAFVKQLCLHEQFLKAASHLLSINKLYEAVDLLRSNKLYREAIALVKARLPADEPLLKELYTCWAAVLEKDGHLSAAAKCYLGAGCSFDAAKVIAKKNDVPSLRTAADLARISGEVVLAQSLVLRCSKDMASAQDWVGAQEVLSSQTPLLAHRLHLCTAELLTVTLADCGVLSLPSSTSSHPWATLKGCNTLQERVIDIWEQEFHICRNPSEDQRVKALLQELKSVETPARSASMSLKQILLYASVHLTRSLLGWLLNDGEMVPELWQAAAWLGDAGNFGVSASFCRLLFPDGDVRVFSSKHSITLQQSEAESSSLQAFVCYHRLYERWWKNCPLQNGNGPREEQNSEARTAETSESKGGVCLKSGSPTDLDFEPAVLLSEPHAHSQGAQRSMREIQEQLSAMVLQHRRVQDGQPEAGNKQDGSVSQTASSDQHEAAEVEKRSEQHETFLSLSSKLSKMQEEVSNIPNTIKTFPRPDVVECCLVLLHLSKSFSISHDLQQQARDLLRKYGTSPSLVKASRGFLT